MDATKNEFRRQVYSANIILNKISKDDENLYEKMATYLINKTEAGEKEVLSIEADIRKKQEVICEMFNIPTDAIDVMWDTIRFNIRAAGSLLLESNRVENKSINSIILGQLMNTQTDEIDSMIGTNERLFNMALKLMKFETGAYLSLIKH